MITANPTDIKYMQRAMDLAMNGFGTVSPNPMVGCVIVMDDKIIGEGWHREYGKAHAEVNAIKSVADKSLLKSSTVYVSLEPCAHYGKTPPCADLLVASQVKKVVIANVDSNALVGGKGIEKLKSAGIEVVTGVCEKAGRELNKRFFTFIEKKRPYIILKWAQTEDGYVARDNYDSKWISNADSRKLVHKWRAEEDAILVGYNTARYDDPQLNVRDWHGRDPLRIVVDQDLSLDEGKLKIFDKSQSTICYNTQKDEEQENLILKKLGKANFLKHLIDDLWERKVQSVIIEGGASTLSQFIGDNRWDEARVFIGQQKFGAGIAAPNINASIFAEEIIKGDRLLIFRNS